MSVSRPVDVSWSCLFPTSRRESAASYLPCSFQSPFLCLSAWLILLEWLLVWLILLGLLSVWLVILGLLSAWLVLLV